MSQNQNTQTTELRHEQRYMIPEYDLWHLKCNEKFLPATWIVDLNSQGASIRVGQFRSYNVGDQIAIRIQHSTDTFVECLAEVKWKKPYAHAVNMDQLGLEFVKEPTTFSKHEVIAHQITKNHLQIHTPKTEKPARRIQFSVEELSSAFTLPFLAGVLFAFLNL